MTAWTKTASALVVAALVAAACGDGDDNSAASPAPSPTLAETAFGDPFLNEVAAAIRPADDVLTGFLQSIEGTYQDREAYFLAVGDLGLRDAIGALLERARALEPPAEHAAEHGLWVEDLQVELTLADEFDAALDDRDLAALSIAAARLNATFSGLLLEITATSPDFCRALTLRDAGSADATCVGPEDLPAGDYESQANLIARRVAASVFPLISTPPLRLLDDVEELAVLAEIQPDAEAGFAMARADLDALSPPDDLSADHQAVLAYLLDIADVARQITGAAEAGDLDALPGLYDASGLPGRMLREALGDDGRLVFGALVPA